jgi:electron transfer flavoprotein alpha subunit
MSILVIAEHDNASLGGATLNTVTAAKQIGGDIDLLIAGNGCSAAAQAAAQVAGVTRVLLADDASLEGQLAENVANLVFTSWKLQPCTYGCHNLWQKFHASRCSIA